MGDYAIIAAAVAGAVAGLLLLRWTGARESADRAKSMAPRRKEPPTPTGYARAPRHSPMPVLVAAGLTLLGAGLAIGSGDDGWDARLLIPGAVVLVSALGRALQQGRSHLQQPSEEARHASEGVQVDKQAHRHHEQAGRELDQPMPSSQQGDDGPQPG